MEKQSRKRIIVAVILWLAVLSWMGLIFSMSAQAASESTKSSDSVITVILRIFNRDFDSLPESQRAEMIDGLEFAVRKLAHFSIFTFLGILTASALFVSFLKKNSRIISYSLISALIGLLYAVSDEIHQKFVPGRSCEFRDVMIDFSGVLLGTIIVSLILFLIRRSKRKKSCSQNTL